MAPGRNDLATGGHCFRASPQDVVDEFPECSGQLGLAHGHLMAVDGDVVLELVGPRSRTGHRVQIASGDESAQHGIAGGVRLTAPLDPGEPAGPDHGYFHTVTPTPVQAFDTASFSALVSP